MAGIVDLPTNALRTAADILDGEGRVYSDADRKKLAAKLRKTAEHADSAGTVRVLPAPRRRPLSAKTRRV